jgi:hypothetical protein
MQNASASLPNPSKEIGIIQLDRHQNPSSEYELSRGDAGSRLPKLADWTSFRW